MIETERAIESENDYLRSFTSDLKEQLKVMSEKLSKLENKVFRNNTEEIICRNCKCRGHIQRFCLNSI